MALAAQCPGFEVHVIALTTVGLEDMFSECSGMVGGHGFQMSEWETAFNKVFQVAFR